jgi:hypothetical protein
MNHRLRLRGRSENSKQLFPDQKVLNHIQRSFKIEGGIPSPSLPVLHFPPLISQLPRDLIQTSQYPVTSFISVIIVAVRRFSITKVIKLETNFESKRTCDMKIELRQDRSVNAQPMHCLVRDNWFPHLTRQIEDIPVS